MHDATYIHDALSIVYYSTCNQSTLRKKKQSIVNANDRQNTPLAIKDDTEIHRRATGVTRPEPQNLNSNPPLYTAVNQT